MKMKCFLILCLAIFGCHQTKSSRIPDKLSVYRNHHQDMRFTGSAQQPKLNIHFAEENEFWLLKAKQFVKEKTEQKRNQNEAKNVIFFLGDGLSMATIAATRVYMGGEEKSLSFESFPYVGMSKTYCIDYQVPDSAATATAYLSGVKANYGTVGVNGNVKRYDCEAELNQLYHTESIAKWASDAGKSIGLVTTSRVTDASPAGLFAHSANRYWEDDEEIRDGGCDPDKNQDIAKQLVYGDVGKKFKVILGGGRRKFRDRSIIDEEYNQYLGSRNDGRDLIDEWLKNKETDTEKRTYVWSAADLRKINITETDYLLGIFEDNNMRYHLEAVENNIEYKEPTLAELTEIAIKMLSKNTDKGYYVFIEGGGIDSAHHDNFARIALDETAEFSKAVDVALRMTNEEDTLIVVTADHSHTLSFSGYADRGNDIFGIAGISTEDHLPLVTLTYANGDGFYDHVNPSGGRVDASKIDSTSNRMRFPSMVPLSSETHGGDDVAVYARGPWSHLFVGTYEQSVLPHLISYSACIGREKLYCQ